MFDFQPVMDAVVHGRHKEVKDLIQNALDAGFTPVGICTAA